MATEETGRKIAAKKLGIPRPPEVRAKIAATMRAKKDRETTMTMADEKREPTIASDDVTRLRDELERANVEIARLRVELKDALDAARLLERPEPTLVVTPSLAPVELANDDARATWGIVDDSDHNDPHVLVTFVFERGDQAAALAAAFRRLDRGSDAFRRIVALRQASKEFVIVEELGAANEEPSIASQLFEVGNSTFVRLHDVSNPVARSASRT